MSENLPSSASESEISSPVAKTAQNHRCVNAPATFETRIASIVPWLYEASKPYWDWLWDSPVEALAQLDEWLRRPGSELSETRVVCLREDDRVLGGYIALPGRELQDCRKADLLTMMNFIRRNPREGLMARMRQARGLFASVAEDEFYLSRIGVASSARGRGLGRRLLQMYLREGQEKNFARFRLDVSANNERALGLYRGAGFVVANESAVPETSICYYSMAVTL